MKPDYTQSVQIFASTGERATMRKKYFVLLTFVLLALTNSVWVSAKGTTAPKLVSAKAIQGIAKDTSDIRYLALSPDGTKIVWLDVKGKQICLIVIADTSNKCFPYGENLGGLGRFSAIAWSPDGRYIATNESFFDYLNDSDIWIFDTTTGQFQDRTDDHYFGNALKLPKTAFADYLPTWNSTTGDLYMFRTPSKEASLNGYETNFYQLPVQDGDPTLLQMLSVRLPPLSVYRPVSISPDGKQMAFLVLPSDYFQNTATGVWVMNLEDKSFKQLVGLSDLQSGLSPSVSDSQKKGLIPNTISWAGNNAIIVSTKDSQVSGLIPQNAYYVDIDKGKATPLLDFSNLQSGADYFKEPADGGLAPAAKSPRAGIVTPDGKGYLYVSTDVPPTSAYVWWKALPPAAEEPTLIGTIKDFQVTPAADAEPSISQDGQEAALFGYLLTLGS